MCAGAWRGRPRSHQREVYRVLQEKQDTATSFSLDQHPGMMSTVYTCCGCNWCKHVPSFHIAFESIATSSKPDPNHFIWVLHFTITQLFHRPSTSSSASKLRRLRLRPSPICALAIGGQRVRQSLRGGGHRADRTLVELPLLLKAKEFRATSKGRIIQQTF